MPNWPARIALAVLGAALPPFLYWLGGHDFERGIAAVWAVVFMACAAFMGITCPIFDKEG